MPIIILISAVFHIIVIPFNWVGININEKLRFSISFKITLVYFRIMVSVFLLCSLSTILAFSFFKFMPTVENNINTLDKIVSGNSIDKIIELSPKNNLNISIFDSSKHPVNINHLDFKNFYYNYSPFRFENYNHFFVYPKAYKINDSKYYFFVHNNISKQIDEIALISFNILVSYVLGILLTTLIGSISNKKVFIPIRKMTQTVKNISAQNLNTRINISGSQDELKDLARTFNETINKIEESYTKQQQFVSDASHELRTPIAVIQGYANMLSRWGKNDTEVLDESINAILEESESMKDLVEKLLFIARNDKDTLNIQKEKFSLSKLLTVIIRETKMIDNHHTISSNLINDIYINGDKNWIKQAIRVFIDNAIKYTQNAGKISISLDIENKFAVISIFDNGFGISNDDLNHIFDRFYRADKSRTKENGGHGLGLSIAKIIILRHGGKIVAKSSEGKGSQFKIFLPL